MTYLAGALLVFAVLLFWAAFTRRRSTRPLTPSPAPRPVTPRQAFRSRPHALYHYLHAYIPGRIYIGISSDPPTRGESHELRSRWFRHSTGQMFVVRWYPDYATAHRAEVAAIRAAHAAGEPLANTAHVPRRRRAAPR